MTKDKACGLTGEQRSRYLRNILLSGVGEAGQEKLLRSSVLLVGAGGLGSPAAYYLAAAGVGRIGLIDADTVSVSNLQRQILHTAADVGRPKVDSARDKLLALNPELVVDTYNELFREETAAELVAAYDFVVDCTDNFPVRYVLNRACVERGVPFVYGGVLAWSGQTFTIMPKKGPCLRCVFAGDPPENAPTTSELGILGAVAGVIGVLQAAEALRYLLGVGELLVGRILTYDALTARFYEVPLVRNENCRVCGSEGGGKNGKSR